MVKFSVDKNKLDRYSCIILDCDGVIFDSNLLKLEAFKNIFIKYDIKLVDKFIEYFKNNFGTSRYSLVKIFIEDYLKVEFSEKLYHTLLKDYGKQCIELYNKANLTNSFIEFLKKNKDKKMYVASGSDELELNIVFRQRNISYYFEKVYGSPSKKKYLVKAICDKNKGKNVVMIGDAKADYLAAKENKIDFIFMSDYSVSDEMKNDNRLISIKNFGDLI